MIRLTREQAREIDRRAIEEYHIPGMVLMENAARSVATVATEMLRSNGGTRVLIVCGSGNNGKDGFAVARMLHEQSFVVETASTDEAFTASPDAMASVYRAYEMGIPIRRATHAKLRRTKCDLIIDALFGTGPVSTPRVSAAELIDAMNTRDLPILAIDVPSGLCCDTGEPLGTSCVRATRTVTFVAEKVGFANPFAKRFLGDIVVGDIGCPPELIEAVRASAR